MVLPAKRRRLSWSRHAAPAAAELLETLTEDELDADHAKPDFVGCGTSACIQCVYKKQLRKLHSLTEISDTGVTWLVYKGGIGCIVCAKVRFFDTYASCKGDLHALKVGNLKRHAASKQHLQSIALLSQEAFSKVYEIPTHDEFKRIWENTRSGKISTSLPGEKLQNHRKTRCMEYCLAEALRATNREFIRDAATVSVNSDGRQGRLLLRFSSVCPVTLSVRRGTLGLERDYGTGNESCERAMMVMFERFATIGACRPHCGQSPPPRDAALIISDLTNLKVHDVGAKGQLDKPLLDQLRAATEMVVADGAGDGHIAYENLKKSEFLPNIKVRHYDAAHGARRMTSRPWQADSVTQDVVNTLIFSRDSLTMLLQNSPDMQRWLQSNLKRCSSVVKMEALASGIRKHRFDSTQLPLARAVLRHEAMVMTAVHIASARRGEHAAACAKYFLLYCSGKEGMRRLLVLAMLADAGDESAMIVRAHDKQHTDPADTAFWIASYIRRVQTLFLEDGCLQTGYTKVMLDRLKDPLVYTVMGTVLQCGQRGGPDDDDINWCLDRLKCWCRMAISTAKAEFPDFTVMYAMSVFKLDTKDVADLHTADSVVSAGSADVDDKLQTLAYVFVLDGDVFAAQFFDVRDIAQAIRFGTAVCDKEAWRTATTKCMATRGRSKHPVDALVVVLQAWIGWNPGTSDIERVFSLHQSIFASSRRGRMSRQREQDVMTLTSDFEPSEADNMIKLASELWKQFYWNVRKERPTTSLRIDKGIKRLPLGREATFKGT